MSQNDNNSKDLIVGEGLPEEEREEEKSPSYWAIVRQQFKQSWLNKLGVVIISILILVALLAPFLANSEPVYLKYQGKVYFPILQSIWPLKKLNLYPELNEVDYDKIEKEGAIVRYTLVPYSPNDYDLNYILRSPDEYHWLGTDEQGRDVLSRMIFGSRISLSVGLVAVSIFTLIGIIFGALAGFFGGRWDWIISRLIEIFICIPSFYLILTAVAVFKPSIYNIMIIIGLTGWPGIARLVRGEFLKFRDQDFVSACYVQGMGTTRIMLRHILPNSLAPVMVTATFGIAGAILLESALSFLGFGVQPPTPSWGDLLNQSRAFIDIAWWLTIFPGVAIFLTVTSFNFVGEGLRDAIDPKLHTG